MSNGELKCWDGVFPYIEINDFYSEDELEKVWKDIDSISYGNKLVDPSQSKSAYVNGQLLKNNSGVFVEECFPDSNIIKINAHRLTELDYTQHSAWYFKNTPFICNDNSTLLSYYENASYYKPHRDNAFFTILIWLYKEPKRFTGGNLHFPDYNHSIEVKNNRFIMFPSMIRHAVDEVSIEEEYRDKFLGRYCLTVFALHNYQFGQYYPNVPIP